MPKPTIHIAVRNFAELVLRHGDLRQDYFAAAKAADGVRMHRKIQDERPDGYQAELPLQFVYETEELILSLAGRIDGLLHRTDLTIVEEIKTTTRSWEQLEAAPDPVHWGQAQCYAFIWACQEGLERIGVQMTYVHPHSGQRKEFLRSIELIELRAFFEDLVRRYLHWFAIQSDWSELRNAAITAMPFPFAGYRTGQREFAVAVFRTIRDSGHLLAQAATGIGKTMAALYPALKALAAGHAPKVLFLTARTTGRMAAESALEMMRERGLRIKFVTLTAKEKICFRPQSACLPEECPYAEGYYDRINDALRAAFDHDAWTRGTIETLADQFRICPFEFSLELIAWADCFIGDYNYLFDPTISLHRLMPEECGFPAVLVDEAHNLVDRSREMFSANLSKEAVLSLRRSVKGELPQLFRILGRINRWLAGARKRCLELNGSVIDHELPRALLEPLEQLLHAAESWLMRNLTAPFKEELVQFFFDGLNFLRTAERFDDSYALICEVQTDDTMVQLFCIDPAPQLRSVWQRCGGAVLFSATLTPVDYFHAVLGCRAGTNALAIPSPFPPGNLTVMLDPHISTLYRQRRASSRAVCEAISRLVTYRAGNYLLFFPSYAYLELVRKEFAEAHPLLRTIVQRPELSEEERERFLAAFDEQVTETLVGFAVMGGIFGEGIDLRGERLTGAVIVGVGLPGISIQRELIRDYFQSRNGRGFEFAYQFPGINRVLQAAGRVIRSEEDRGAVLLIDRRYLEERYRSLLPAGWAVQTIRKPEDLNTSLSLLWDRT